MFPFPARVAILNLSNSSSVCFQRSKGDTAPRMTFLRTCLLALSLITMRTMTYTNTKTAHISQVAKKHLNPNMVGYTATAEMPDFHFRCVGTMSAATEYAQVTVKFNLAKLRRYIRAVSTTVREAAALTPQENGIQIHMYQQLDTELRLLKERTNYIHHFVS